MTTQKPASLGSLEFDAIVSRSESMDCDIPEYATEAGYSVSDNICLKALTLEVEAIISNTPVTWSKEHSPSNSRVETLCDEFRKLWKAKKVLTFTAGSDVYENVCIESLTLPRKAENGSSVYVSLTLKQVTITATDTAAISIKYARGGKSGKNTGSGQVKTSTAKSPKSTGTKSSILLSGAKAAGLLK